MTDLEKKLIELVNQTTMNLAECGLNHEALDLATKMQELILNELKNKENGKEKTN